jgi:uncharacterized protein (TIGR03435 family)
MKSIRGITAAFAVAVVASIALVAQAPPPHTEFEVASIKPSAPPGQGQVNVGVHIDGARLSCTYLSLKDYIRVAYRIKEHQVVGPDWLASARFDIAATLPAGTPREKVPDLLKTLLTDRFRMTTHQDSKEFPVYALVVAKGGPKMKESAIDPDASGNEAGGRGAVNVNASGGRGGVMVDLGNGSFFSFADNRIQAGKITMAGFVDSLARYVDLPVVDMTELKGNYDIKLEFSPEDYRGMLIRSAVTAGVALPPEVVKQALENSSGDSLFAAIQTLGLKMERRKAPLEVIVIDKMDKLPSDN